VSYPISEHGRADAEVLLELGVCTPTQECFAQQQKGPGVTEHSETPVDRARTGERAIDSFETRRHSAIIFLTSQAKSAM
jgi:hypothetical protein